MKHKDNKLNNHVFNNEAKSITNKCDATNHAIKLLSVIFRV